MSERRTRSTSRSQSSHPPDPWQTGQPAPATATPSSPPPKSPTSEDDVFEEALQDPASTTQAQPSGTATAASSSGPPSGTTSTAAAAAAPPTPSSGDSGPPTGSSQPTGPKASSSKRKPSKSAAPPPPPPPTPGTPRKPTPPPITPPRRPVTRSATAAALAAAKEALRIQATLLQDLTTTRARVQSASTEPEPSAPRTRAHSVSTVDEASTYGTARRAESPSAASVAAALKHKGASSPRTPRRRSPKKKPPPISTTTGAAASTSATAPASPVVTTPVVTSTPSTSRPASPSGTTPAVTTTPSTSRPASPHVTTPVVTPTPSASRPASPSVTTPLATTSTSPVPASPPFSFFDYFTFPTTHGWPFTTPTSKPASKAPPRRPVKKHTRGTPRLYPIVIPTMGSTADYDTLIRRKTAKAAGEPSIKEIIDLCNKIATSQSTNAAREFYAKYMSTEGSLQDLYHKLKSTDIADRDQIYLTMTMSMLAEIKREMAGLRGQMYKVFAMEPAPFVTSGSGKIHVTGNPPLEDVNYCYTELVEMLNTLEVEILKTKDVVEKRQSNLVPPKASIPRFSGNHADWLEFKSVFTNLTYSLPAIDKLRLLQDSLQGSSAQTAIKDLRLEDANFDIAWQRLLQRYDSTREIIHHVLRPALDYPVMTSESVDGLYHLLSVARATMDKLNHIPLGTVPIQEVIFLHIYLGRIPSKTLTAFNQTLKANDVPSLDKFFEFLNNRAKELSLESSIRTEVSGQRHPDKKWDNKQKEKPRTQPFLHATQKGGKKQPPHKGGNKQPPSQKAHNSKQPGTKPKPAGKKEPLPCAGCHEPGHKIYTCTMFQQLTTTQRKSLAQQHKLCTNCLSTTHPTKDCTSKFTCSVCKRKHHSLLHAADVTPTGSINHFAVQRKAPPKPDQIGLLATALAKVKGKHIKTARILLDSGAQGNFVKASFLRNMKIPITRESQEFTLAGEQPLTSTGSVTLTLQSYMIGEPDIVIKAHLLPTLTSQQPDEKINVSQWEHIQDLTLADPGFNIPGPVDLIIGMPLLDQLLLEGVIRGRSGLASARKTPFGWVLMGSRTPTHPQAVIYTITSKGEEEAEPSNDEVHALIQRFWDLDKFENADPRITLTPVDQFCQDHFKVNTTRREDGRFVVKWPFLKSPEKDLGSSFKQARSRYESIERKLQANPAFHEKYISQLQEYVTVGDMVPVPPEEVRGKPCYYIPHHGVFKESSTTTKLRIVFDASAKTTNGESLNSLLPPGPVLQPDLFRQLLHFREHPIALKADITKMYRQIRVHPTEQDYQRILWRASPNEPIGHFKLTCVPFGVTTAPYIACKTLETLAKQSSQIYPEASQLLSTRFYMDDLSTSLSDISIAKQAVIDLVEMLHGAHFQLRKWASNSPEIMALIPIPEREASDILDLDDTASVKTLGLTWVISSDSFNFYTNPDINKKHTKRNILSETSKVFDPLGLISPITIKSKILLQQLWMRKLDWDVQLPPDLSASWLELADSLATMDLLPIPRILIPADATNVELHGFADASKDAYAAVIYIRCKTSSGFYTNIITAKTRVAPLSPLLTIPRMELQAAVLLSELMQTVQETLTTKIEKRFFWTDSAIVLHWLQAVPSKWKLYVANRISTIQQTSKISEWAHVISEENPADCASRGLLPSELRNHPLWWTGPEWLKNEEIVQPGLPGIPDQSDLEVKKTPVALGIPAGQATFLQRIRRIGSWHKTVRIIALIAHVFRRKSFATETLAPEDYTRAECVLVHHLQMEHYSEVFSGKNMTEILKDPNLKRLRKLLPFLKDDFTLHVKGRLENADLPYLHRHPYILPGQDPLVRSLIMEHHYLLAHAGTKVLLNTLRSKFWILNGKTCVKSVIDKCLLCFKYNARPCEQLMGQLPAARVSLTRPFLHTGVDFAGPYFIKNNTGRGGPFKTWICLFTCMAVRAVHLELVSSLSAEAFLLAFRRFISRRGRPSHMYSDNGTNFKGAEHYLTDQSSFLIHEHTTSKCSEWGLDLQNITWKFMPPIAPHHGGVWEVCVKLVKTHLKKLLSEELYTWEQFETFLLWVESIVNSRPLVPLDDDPDSLDPLTPGHFLIGTNLQAIPEVSLLNHKNKVLSMYQIMTKRFQQLWQEWQRDFLSELQRQQKWLAVKDNLHVGDMVIIMDDQLPPLKWKMGRVKAVHPGKDNLVRVATIDVKKVVPGSDKVTTKDTVRPISRLAKLPLEDDNEAVLSNSKAPKAKRSLHNIQFQMRSAPTVSIATFLTTLFALMPQTHAQNPQNLSTMITYNFGAMSLAIAIAGIMANLAAIYRLSHTTKTTAYNFLLWTLCISDLIIAAVLIPMTATRYLAQQWILGSVLCNLYAVCLYGTVTLTIITLVGIAALRYHKFVTSKYNTPDPVVPVKVCIAVTVTASYALPTLAYTGLWGTIGKNPHDPTTCTILPDAHGFSPKSTIWMLGGFAPLLLIYILSLILYIKIRQYRKSFSGRTTHKSLHHLRWTMTHVVCSFLFGYQPLLIMNCIDNQKKLSPYLHFTGMILAWMTTILHPAVYLFRKTRRPNSFAPPRAPQIAVIDITGTPTKNVPQIAVIDITGTPTKNVHPKGRRPSPLFGIILCLCILHVQADTETNMIKDSPSPPAIHSVITDLPICAGDVPTPKREVPPCTSSIVWLHARPDGTACIYNNRCTPPRIFSSDGLSCVISDQQCTDTKKLLDNLHCQEPQGGEQPIHALVPESNPDLCHVDDLPLHVCKHFRTTVQEVPVLLIKGTLYPVKSLHMRQHTVLNSLSSYNCSCHSKSCPDNICCQGNKKCQGDETFCKNMGCSATVEEGDDLCYCRFNHTHTDVRKIYSTKLGPIYPDCYGTILTSTRVRILPPSQEVHCPDCTATCNPQGVEVHTPEQVASYIIITKNPGHISAHPTTETTQILLTTHMLVSHGVTKVEIWLPEADAPHEILLDCPRVSICQAIRCHMCKDRWVNVACYSAINWIILVGILGVASVFIYIGRSCLYCMFICCFYITLPLRHYLRWRVRRDTRPVIIQDEETGEPLLDYNYQVYVPPTVAGRSERRNRRGGFSATMTTLLCIICSFTHIQACSEFASLAASSMECINAGSTEACKVHLNTRLALSPIGQTSCFKVNNAQQKVLGTVEITTNAVSISCDKQLLYYAPRPKIACDSSIHCYSLYSSSSCNGDKCSQFRWNDTIPEFEATKNNLGWSRCLSLRYPSCPWFLTRDCVFVRSAIINPSHQSYEVFSCPEWKLWANLQIQTRYGSNQRTDAVVLEVGTPQTINNITYSLVSASVPPTPVLSQCFLRRNAKIALAPCNHREEFAPGRLGEIQCDSVADARKLSSNCKALPSLITSETDTEGIHCQGSLIDPEKLLNDQLLPLKLDNGILVADNLAVRYDTTVSSLIEIQLSATNLQLVAEAQEGHCQATFLKIEGCYSCLPGAVLFLQANTDAATPLTATLSCPGHTLYTQLVVNNVSTYYKKIVHVDKPHVEMQCSLQCPMNSVPLMIKGTLHYLSNPDVENIYQEIKVAAVKDGGIDFHWISIMGSDIWTWLKRGTIIVFVLIICFLCLSFAFRLSNMKRD